MIFHPKPETMKHANRFLITAMALLASAPLHAQDQSGADPRPNILWIVAEDMSCHFGYQGEKRDRTPHVDRLAREGAVFENAYVTAPVCSASRSAMITGMYQTSIGAQHHRSSRGTHKIHLPAGVRTIPEIFKEAGYYTCNLGFGADLPNDFTRPGKEDYNFVYKSRALYDGPDWSGRAAGQPFFAQVQLRGGKLRNVEKWQQEMMSGLDRSVTPEEVTLPPYYPRDAAFREDWAAYLNTVQYTDKEVGLVLARLERENLLDQTIIVFLTDHGISQARGKQFLYDEGTRIPFIVRAPGRVAPGTRRGDLIAHIDMAATSLAWAGIAVPDPMQGRDLFAGDFEPRNFVVTARDRCDETEDRIRSLREGNFKYIRNAHPLRPYLQPSAYKDGKPWMQPLRDLHKAGKLDAVQSLILADQRPEEELYNLSADPFEVRNLAGHPDQRERLAHFRQLLEAWEKGTGDMGRDQEPEAAYDGEMAVYLKAVRRNNPIEATMIQSNISLMKEWRSARRNGNSWAGTPIRPR